MSDNRAGGGPPPRIVVTLEAPAKARDPQRTAMRTARYLGAVESAGGLPVPLDESASDEDRAAAFATMDGLLLSGGADLDPALYEQSPAGSRASQPGRDALELGAWREARRRGIPVLGVCRGFQAINVFSGGSLVQDLAGHEPADPKGASLLHPLRLRPGSRLARILRPRDPSGGVLEVNSSHHQAVRADGLAPSLIAAGTSPHPGGELVEALESADPSAFVIGVQCHPERTESTPPEFARLWSVFVDASRGSARGDRVG